MTALQNLSNVLKNASKNEPGAGPKANMLL
jgi:hypothetical protein